ncbi:MAG: Rrf2 family protein [Verrucomicrobiales bacterium]|jgi:Rrf2 family protein
MSISKKAEYALRALTILATRSAAAPVQAQDLAAAGQLPVKFLEQILLALKRAGLLRSKRGAGGGYLLNRTPAEISLAEVIRSVDGAQMDEASTGLNGLDSSPGCQGLGECLSELSQLVSGFLERETIQSLLAREEPGVLAFDI